MAMNYGTVKAINIVLGWICLALESYVYNESYVHAAIDEAFLIVVSFCIIEAIVALFLSCLCKNNVWPRIDRIVRAIACFALSFVGGGVIYSAIYIKDDCGDHCQPWEVKIVAGIVCIVNAIFHGSARNNRYQNAQAIVYAYPPHDGINVLPQSNYNMHSPGIPMTTIIHQGNAGYVYSDGYQPQNYQIPAFQVQGQTGYQYNNYYNPNQQQPMPIPGNYSQPQMPSYPPQETGAQPQQKSFVTSQF